MVRSFLGGGAGPSGGLQPREVGGRLDPELAQGLDHLLLDGRGRELVAPILSMRDVFQVGHRDDRRSEQDERVELDIGAEPPDACALGRGGEAAVSDEAARLRVSETDEEQFIADRDVGAATPSGPMGRPFAKALSASWASLSWPLKDQPQGSVGL
jgi:hypothetical protein